MNKEQGTPAPAAREAAAERQFSPLSGEDFDALGLHEARVFKAGNSLAIRIPSAVAKRIGLEDGTPVEVASGDGMLYIRKAPSQALNDLIERITPENSHAALFDEAVAAERW